MINLFNIDIDTIKFNGNEIIFMKLDNDIIFSNITAGGIYNSYQIYCDEYNYSTTISLTKKSCNTSYNLITDWGDGIIDIFKIIEQMTTINYVWSDIIDIHNIYRFRISFF